MITDEMVEAAALLLFNRMRIRRKMLPVYYIGANNTPECNECRDEARAALEAVLPMIRAEVLEEAAMVADGYHQRALAWARTVRDLEKHIDETDSSRIAAAIRALSPREAGE